jgi:hypothetical protein
VAANVESATTIALLVRDPKALNAKTVRKDFSFWTALAFPAALE